MSEPGAHTGAPRFRLGDPGDAAEAAADRLADHVVAVDRAVTRIGTA